MYSSLGLLLFLFRSRCACLGLGLSFREALLQTSKNWFRRNGNIRCRRQRLWMFAQMAGTGVIQLVYKSYRLWCSFNSCMRHCCRCSPGLHSGQHERTWRRTPGLGASRILVQEWDGREDGSGGNRCRIGDRYCANPWLRGRFLRGYRECFPS